MNYKDSFEKIANEIKKLDPELKRAPVNLYKVYDAFKMNNDLEAVSNLEDVHFIPEEDNDPIVSDLLINVNGGDEHSDHDDKDNWSVDRVLSNLLSSIN